MDFATFKTNKEHQKQPALTDDPKNFAPRENGEIIAGQK